MKRRSFLAAAASVAGAGVLAGPGEAQRSGGGSRQFVELRRYTFASDSKRKAFEEFCESGLAPALHRAGIRPVGVFQLRKADNPQAAFSGDISPELYVLLPHPSLESIAALETKLAADAALQTAYSALGETPKDPAYLRYESSVLRSLEQWPHVEAPQNGASRLLQLRIYESSNAERGNMKVRMFNEGGEIRIFREAGMTPVFFGQAIAGTKLPNITYMLAWENADASKAGWAKFGQHPDWQKLKDDATYKDTVTNITNLILRPTGGSQI
jgi:hypothetical protein